MKLNEEILKGFFALLLFTTLMWSLNINFGFIKVSWFEIFGVVCGVFMIASSFIGKNKDE